MNTVLDRPGLDDPSQLLSDEQLVGLARTYDTVTAPIWVEDLEGLCIYQNPSVDRLNPADWPRWKFDILDHAGRVVARLLTCGPR